MVPGQYSGPHFPEVFMAILSLVFSALLTVLPPAGTGNSHPPVHNPGTQSGLPL